MLLDRERLVEIGVGTGGPPSGDRLDLRQLGVRGEAQVPTVLQRRGDGRVAEVVAGGWTGEAVAV